MVEGFIAEALAAISADVVREEFGGILDLWLKRRAAEGSVP